jgi:hypothetical protein
MAQKPRLKRDWIGRYVRLLCRLEARGGQIFEEGEVMRVEDNHGGLTLEAVRACPYCRRLYRHRIRKVSMGAVILLPMNYQPPEGDPPCESRECDQR